MKTIETYVKEFVEFNKPYMPYLIGINIALGIFALLMGWWAEGLFNLFAAFTMYFVYYRLDK